LIEYYQAEYHSIHIINFNNDDALHTLVHKVSIHATFMQRHKQKEPTYMTTNLFDLTGKIALVTGASRGIGEEIARLLAQQGAHVIVSSRKIEGCQEVADSINSGGDSAEAFACHVGNMDDIAGIFRHIEDTHGKLDILVNNAATNPFFGDILDTDLAAFNKTMDVNVRGYFFMSVAGAKLMKDNGGGAIVNTASVNALHPAPMQGIYSISKAAVVSMTGAFAKECAPHGIRVNALLPGLTKTKFAGALFAHKEIYDMAMATIPMGRHAEPREMAGTVLYLVSDAASYTTGECIVVDGGMTI
jgi:NAD(P)-dependent dehydrogenase (short-subunit alcohol dehydrogenase family)